MSEPSEFSDQGRIRPVSPPLEVPVFNIVVFLSCRKGGVQARVANLPELSCVAASEPLALKQIVTEAKRRLATWDGSGEAIPWIVPMPQLNEGEQERLVPVHL